MNWKNTDPRHELIDRKWGSIVILRPDHSGRMEAGTGHVETKHGWYVHTSFPDHPSIETWDPAWKWTLLPGRDPERDEAAVERLVKASVEFLAWRNKEKTNTAVPFMAWLHALRDVEPEAVKKILDEADARAVSCPTCNGTKKVDYDLGRPHWPATEITPETPSAILRDVACPDCVPCVQCANPGHDGICTCRNFKPSPNARILPCST